MVREIMQAVNWLVMWRIQSRVIYLWEKADCRKNIQMPIYSRKDPIVKEKIDKKYTTFNQSVFIWKEWLLEQTILTEFWFLENFILKTPRRGFSVRNIVAILLLNKYSFQNSWS